jgi:hypothetical protein
MCIVIFYFQPYAFYKRLQALFTRSVIFWSLNETVVSPLFSLCADKKQDYKNRDTKESFSRFFLPSNWMVMNLEMWTESNKETILLIKNPLVSDKLRIMVNVFWASTLMCLTSNIYNILLMPQNEGYPPQPKLSVFWKKGVYFNCTNFTFDMVFRLVTFFWYHNFVVLIGSFCA